MNIELCNISHSFGERKVLDRFCALFPANKVTVLLGPSGCGKTTILNILAGILNPQGGTVQIGGLPSTKVRVGYMFQDVRLVPWLTVKKNLELVLPRTLPKQEMQQAIFTVMSQLGLEHASSLYPDQLSGGMFRRVGLGRAYLFKPDIYLMDESLQGLDPPLKFQLLKDFQRLLAKNPKTTVFVTHDIEEALLLGDEIHLLSLAPAKIVYSLQNPVKLEERMPGHPELARLEGHLFALFCKESRL
ncbi:MAG: ABC transporter ATP-binding protein [Spirochaetales bacterium]